MLVLTGAINRNFEGFSSVICTTVATKSKQTKLQHCYCLTRCLQTLVIEYNRLSDGISVDRIEYSIRSPGNNL